MLTYMVPKGYAFGFQSRTKMHKPMIWIMALLLCVAVTACGGGYSTGKLQQSEQVSECGGFATTGKIWLGDPAAYCDAEVLHWYYQPDTRSLQLVDARAYLNCCSERHISAVLANDVYHVTETISADSAKGWCLCQCVFDLSIQIQEINTTEVRIKIMRQVNDDSASKIILYNDTLDLSPLSGTISLDETAIDSESCPGKQQ
jgi:hypothetical protein